MITNIMEFDDSTICCPCSFSNHTKIVNIHFILIITRLRIYENSYFYKLIIKLNTDNKVETWMKDILSSKDNKISMV